MRRNVRHCLFLVSAIGLLVAGLAAVGTSAASSDNSATIAIDCSSLSNPTQQNQCNSFHCEQRPQIPPCRKLEITGDKPTNPNPNPNPTTCKTGQTPATVNGKSTCLKGGQKCRKKFKSDYAAAGFKCKGRKKHGHKVYKLKATGG